MYTAYIGRRIVDLYNERLHDGPPLTPKDFFDDVFFPLFFDHERYFLWVNNSPFDQAYKQRRRTPLTEEVRQEKLAEFHKEVASADVPSAHLFAGGQAREVDAVTSGQVTDVATGARSEDAYCSWFGFGAAIRVGRLSLLVDEDSVLLPIVEGWSHLRTYMNQTSSLKSHQVDTWNAWWLVHRFGDDYHPGDPLRDFAPDIGKAGKNIKLKSQSWARVLFALASNTPGESTSAYIFALGQTNTTIGFRQLRLPEVNYLSQLYTHMYGEAEGLLPGSLADVFEADFSLYRASEQGALGLKALRPKDITKYMPGRNSKMPSSTRSERKRTNYLIYQTWIIAMLNNQDLIDVTEETAQALLDHARSGTNARSKALNRTKQVLDATHKREFLGALTTVIEEGEEKTDHFDALADEVVNMPASDFPLFATLLRLKYAVISK